MEIVKIKPHWRSGRAFAVKLTQADEREICRLLFKERRKVLDVMKLYHISSTRLRTICVNFKGLDITGVHDYERKNR